MRVWRACVRAPLHISLYSFVDCSAPTSNTYCGTYTDGCRGGSVNADSDNLVRTLVLLGENFGEFEISQSMYLPQDTDCDDGNLNALIRFYGTFAMHGASDCGGSCEVLLLWLLLLVVFLLLLLLFFLSLCYFLSALLLNPLLLNIFP